MENEVKQDVMARILDELSQLFTSSINPKLSNTEEIIVCRNINRHNF